MPFSSTTKVGVVTNMGRRLEIHVSAPLGTPGENAEGTITLTIPPGVPEEQQSEVTHQILTKLQEAIEECGLDARAIGEKLRQELEEIRERILVEVRNG